jgi:endonuclease-8
LWSATEIDLIPTVEEHLHSFLAKLGPDVLDEAITTETLLQQLTSKKCLRKKAATIMLDQGCFAGLGNYLRSEILFTAGVHPDDRPCDLPEHVLEKWARAIKEVSVQAYREAGVTVPKEVAEASKARGEPRRMWRHYAFCRNEHPCLVCASLIVRLRYGGRRLDHCPTCQSAHRPRAQSKH